MICAACSFFRHPANVLPGDPAVNAAVNAAWGKADQVCPARYPNHLASGQYADGWHITASCFPTAVLGEAASIQTTFRWTGVQRFNQALPAAYKHMHAVADWWDGCLTSWTLLPGYAHLVCKSG